MLGKYGRYNELKNGDDFDEWIDGFQRRTAEIPQFENWIYHLVVAMLKHPQLYFVVHDLAESES
jgi:hypothetical protein